MFFLRQAVRKDLKIGNHIHAAARVLGHCCSPPRLPGTPPGLPPREGGAGRQPEPLAAAVAAGRAEETWRAPSAPPLSAWVPEDLYPADLRHVLVGRTRLAPERNPMKKTQRMKKPNKQQTKRSPREETSFSSHVDRTRARPAKSSQDPSEWLCGSCGQVSELRSIELRFVDSKLLGRPTFPLPRFKIRTLTRAPTA